MSGTLLTLGLDGAAWHKLDRMMDAGELPNIARLVEEGARGTLESVDPPVTCPAWRCSTSGKNPGRLGVFWWLNLDRETGEITSPDARSFDTADAWDYLSEAGYRSAVLNVPMTYPPTELDGLMVSGFGAPFEFDVDGGITHPPGVAADLREEYDWKIGVEDVAAPGGPEEVYDVIRSRFDLLLDLLAEGTYDYLHLTVFYINMLQHKFGDGPETAEGWQLIDEYVGQLPDDVTKVIYSDHGHSHIDRTFVVNKYLIDEGYLRFEGSTGDRLTGTIYSLLKRSGVSPRDVARLAGTVLPDPLFERLVESGYPIPTFELVDRVDWSESTAVAMSQGPIYLNRDLLGGDYESVRDRLRGELAELTVDGERPLAAVHTAEEVYDGPYVEDAPDLMLVSNDGWEIYGGVTPSIVERQVTSWTSGNHPEGIVLAHGPDVPAGRLGTHSLVDVMPTVLRYFDRPVPRDVDGTAIDAFEDPLPETGRCPPLDAPRSRRSPETDRRLEGRLEDLGYLE